MHTFNALVLEMTRLGMHFPVQTKTPPKRGLYDNGYGNRHDVAVQIRRGQQQTLRLDQFPHPQSAHY